MARSAFGPVRAGRNGGGESARRDSAANCAAAEPDIRAIALISAGRAFIVGAAVLAGHHGSSDQFGETRSSSFYAHGAPEYRPRRTPGAIFVIIGSHSTSFGHLRGRPR